MVKSEDVFISGAADQKEARRIHGDILKKQGRHFPSYFQRTHTTEQIIKKWGHLKPEEQSDETVLLAGRIMALRNQNSFGDLEDAWGKIQFFYPRSVDPLVKDALDILDLVGVTGRIRRTPRGELTIDVKNITVLTKAFLPPAHKIHGLKDTETRYRQRYLDLLTNVDSRIRLKTRFQCTSWIRRYLEDEGFLEVETPMLHAVAGGALAKPFVTHHNALHRDLYLRIAPELHLKRLLVGGMVEKIFELNRCFRNEGISTKHNPEFTTLEVYQAFSDWRVMMQLTENLAAHLCEKVFGRTNDIPFGDHKLNFTPPWPKLSMADAVKKVCGWNFMSYDRSQAFFCLRQEGVAVNEHQTWGELLEAAFGHFVEPTLIQPTHITHHPVDISPLARQDGENSVVTQRFESYVNTWEIANGFSELNDPFIQHERFVKQCKNRDEELRHPIDQDFIEALGYGMPPSSGLGLGIDRLAMILTNVTSISEVIAFPATRSK